jgi:hypothetical protein
MDELNEYRKRLVKRYADIATDFEALITQISLDDGNKPDDQRSLSLHRVIAHLRDVEKQVFLPYFERIWNEDFPSLANDSVSIKESERHNAAEPFETISLEPDRETPPLRCAHIAVVCRTEPRTRRVSFAQVAKSNRQNPRITSIN